MPRPKLNYRTISWTRTRYRLSEDRRLELVSLLGLDPKADAEDKKNARKAIRKVEYWLSLFLGEVEAHHKAPKSSDYRAVLPSIEKSIRDLIGKLAGLHDWIIHDINKQPMDVLDPGKEFADLDKLEAHDQNHIGKVHDDIKQRINIQDQIENLIHLKKAVRRVIDIHENKESRGKPKNMPMRRLIFKLHNTFITFRKDGTEHTSNRSRIGAINPLAEDEAELCEFIDLPLRDAGIKPPADILKFLDEVKEMDENLKAWKLLFEDVLIDDEDGGWHVERRYYYPEPFPEVTVSDQNN